MSANRFVSASCGRQHGFVRSTPASFTYFQPDLGRPRPYQSAGPDACPRIDSLQALLAEMLSQFTSAAFTGVLECAGIQISMDRRGRWMDNVFIERLWRSLKHEDVYLKGYADGRELHEGLSDWIAFYNDRRLHQALGYRAPMAVWRHGISSAVDVMDNTEEVFAHMPTTPTSETDNGPRGVIRRSERRDLQEAVPVVLLTHGVLHPDGYRR
jgi:hypothetical protein